MGITPSVAAVTESHHVGKGQRDEASTFVECAGVCGDDSNNGTDTLAEERDNGGVSPGVFRGAGGKEFSRGLAL